MTRLDDSDPRPAYAQIAEQLRAAYTPSGRLPSTDALAEQYGVARLTARKAVQVLRDEGLAVASVGRGTFYVSERPVRPLPTERDRLADLAAELRDISNRITELARDTEQADAAGGTKPPPRRKGPNPDTPASEYRFLP